MRQKNYLISAGLFVLIVVYVCILGLSNLLSILGWAAFLFALIIFLLIFSINKKKYYINFLIYIIILGGFIFLNHLIFSLLDHKKFAESIYLKAPPVFMFIISLPFGALQGFVWKQRG